MTGGPRVPTPVVEVRIWGVDRVLPALGRMATGHLRLRHTPGLRFLRLLGTGSGATFTPRDADLHHWAMLSVHDDGAAADAFAASPALRGWDATAHEQLVVRMSPLVGRGRWSGVDPFGVDPAVPGPGSRPDPWVGPVAAITRARLRAGRSLSFWGAVPPVVAELRRSAGVRLAVGVGEAPVGLQGTVSVWGSERDLVDFAYRSDAHRRVIRETRPQRWYAEDLFVRFGVLDIRGTYGGDAP